MLARRSQSSFFSMSEKGSRSEATGGANISLNNLSHSRPPHFARGNAPVVHVTCAKPASKSLRLTNREMFRENITVHNDDEWESQKDHKVAVRSFILFAGRPADRAKQYQYPSAV